MGGETRVLRERSWGEINTITKDDFKTNYARNWMFKNTDPLYWRPPAGESIADVAENRVHNMLTSLSRKSDAESVVMVTHGDFMLALMLTIGGSVRRGIPAPRRLRTTGRSPTAPACTIHAATPATGRTSKRLRWEQTARPVLDETTGRWVVKVERGANSSARISPMAIWWMWCRPSTLTCWSITANSLSRKRDFTKSS